MYKLVAILLILFSLQNFQAYAAPQAEPPEQRQASPYYQPAAVISWGEFIGSVTAATEMVWEFATNLVQDMFIGQFLEGFLTPLLGQFFPFFGETAVGEVSTELTGEKMIEDDAKAHRSFLSTKEDIREDATMNIRINKDIERERMLQNQELASLRTDSASNFCAQVTNRNQFLQGLAAARATSTKNAAGGGGKLGHGRGALTEIQVRGPCERAFTRPDNMNGAFRGNEDALSDEMVEGCIQDMEESYGGQIRRTDCNIDATASFTQSYETSITDGERFLLNDSESCGLTTEATDNAEKDMFMANVFTNDNPTPVPEGRIEDMVDADTGTVDSALAEYLLAKRSLDAYNSVSKNIFNLMKGWRAPSNADTEGTIFGQLDEVFQMDTDNCEDQLCNKIRQIQNNPSYRAQLMGLAKMMYMQPGFIADIDESAALQNIVLANATKNMVAHEILESAQRQEIILATLIELELHESQQELESLSANIRAR